MGDSLKEFLRSRSRPLDDIPSEKFPEGKSYTFTAPPWKTCLTLKAMFMLGLRSAAGVAATPGDLTRLSKELLGEQVEEAQKSDQHAEELFYRKVMGDTYDELVEDGVDGDAMEGIFLLLMRKYGGGEDIAVQLAQVDSSGEAEARPNRQTRRSAGRKAASKSSRASGATPSPQTRARASTPTSKTPVEDEAAATG